MRKLIVTVPLALLAGLTPLPVLAQNAAGGRGDCDGSAVAGRPDCLGYNPFYATPASYPSRVTDRDIVALAQKMRAAQTRNTAESVTGADATKVSATSADAAGGCPVIRVVYGGYGEPTCSR